eukprot:scaffold2284_cov402-Prasinococcus_capsulatus_cf.AAC.16
MLTALLRVRLPSTYDAWEELAAQMPQLLLQQQFTCQVDENLPLLDDSALEGQHQLRRAKLLLSFLVQAYVWGDGKVNSTLPDQLAVPFCAVADRLGVPPMISHASLVLYGYHRVDSSRPVVVENLSSPFTWTRTPDESWFFLLTVQLEAVGGETLPFLWRAQRQALHLHQLIGGRSDAPLCGTSLRDLLLAIASGLQRVEAGLVSMKEVLGRMKVGCRPEVFYHQIRPFVSGWSNNPSLPEGVWYAHCF